MTKSKNNPGRSNTIRESNTMKVMEEIREKIRKAIKEGVSLREIEEIILQEAMMEEREKPTCKLRTTTRTGPTSDIWEPETEY
ncbi:hypothetical protein LD85_0936 [Saccharolobus islandicus L.D.8.5]|uniref:Uncharacterized protein n=1 Tax=Saccharolobus islandicus (strain L.D.8.5 / Lassen \|nr:hypothetical protein LD85_0936 [Sulfolobus islandicus L.D.8.5]